MPAVMHSANGVLARPQAVAALGEVHQALGRQGSGPSTMPPVSLQKLAAYEPLMKLVEQRVAKQLVYKSQVHTTRCVCVCVCVCECVCVCVCVWGQVES